MVDQAVEAVAQAIRGLEGTLPEKYVEILHQFFENYWSIASQHAKNKKGKAELFHQFVKLVEEQSQNPYSFSHYHKGCTHPVDFFQFGLDFINVLVDRDRSLLLGEEHLKKIQQQVDSGENVVFFANHQTEADPQILALMLCPDFASLARDMIFVAGERVTTDPLAAPFSRGCNLLCIYSKKYIANPPEEKHAKQLHNKRTMQAMGSLLDEGGKCIYVAPSGGRDRINEQGEITVAPFDPQSIGMFHLIARGAKKATHFYPLALATYRILPPPDRVETSLGERRVANYLGAGIAFGPEVDMEAIQDLSLPKQQQREVVAEKIFDAMKSHYERLEQQL